MENIITSYPNDKVVIEFEPVYIKKDTYVLKPSAVTLGRMNNDSEFIRENDGTILYEANSLKALSNSEHNVTKSKLSNIPSSKKSSTPSKSNSGLISFKILKIFSFIKKSPQFETNV